ncbi:hypothetical protein ACER0C_023589 [Sarotherodon galilaeus]
MTKVSNNESNEKTSQRAGLVPGETKRRQPENMDFSGGCRAASMDLHEARQSLSLPVVKKNDESGVSEALYFVPMDPKALYTTFSHPLIHPLVMASYIVATAALGRTDRGEAAGHWRRRAL